MSKIHTKIRSQNCQKVLFGVPSPWSSSQNCFPLLHRLSCQICKIMSMHMPSSSPLSTPSSSSWSWQVVPVLILAVATNLPKFFEARIVFPTRFPLTLERRFQMKIFQRRKRFGGDVWSSECSEDHLRNDRFEEQSRLHQVRFGSGLVGVKTSLTQNTQLNRSFYCWGLICVFVGGNHPTHPRLSSDFMSITFNTSKDNITVFCSGCILLRGDSSELDILSFVILPIKVLINFSSFVKSNYGFFWLTSFVLSGNQAREISSKLTFETFA